MRRRFLEALGVAALIMAVVLLLKFARAPVSAQTGQPGTAAKAGPAPTTPSGEPDLQGIWTRDSDEPLQRPAKYASKETFTDEERAALDKQIAEIVGREASEERRQRGTEQDVGGAYNAAVFTSHLRTGRRTSMIIDPPDGRIPAITAEEQKKRNEFGNTHSLSCRLPTFARTSCPHARGASTDHLRPDERRRLPITS